MLQSIAVQGHMVFLCVDGVEYRDLDLPDQMLTLDELKAVRDASGRPDILPAYIVKEE